jgi:hypothetical protein
VTNDQVAGRRSHNGKARTPTVQAGGARRQRLSAMGAASGLRPASSPTSLSCPRSSPAGSSLRRLAGFISAGDHTSTYAQGVRTPALHSRIVCPGRAPLGGVERPRRAVRFARLIHTARPRSWRTFGLRRFGGKLSLPWLLPRVVPDRGRTEGAQMRYKVGVEQVRPWRIVPTGSSGRPGLPGRPNPCGGHRDRQRRPRDQDRWAGRAGPRLGRSVLRREVPRAVSRPSSPSTRVA